MPEDEVEVYVHMIDGTAVWVPMPAHEVSAGEYRLLDSPLFDPAGTTALLQFIPGDVVRLRDGRAAKLVSSSHPDRAYWSALYGVAAGEPHLESDPVTVRRIASEVKAGSRRHYPAVMKWATEHA